MADPNSARAPSGATGVLVLASGQVIWGRGFGAVGQAVGEVCFKELYVSSLSENPWAMSQENLFATKNQVPLSLAVAALRDLGFEQCSALPWGAPVFKGVVQGMSMSVAAYTEPSVGWELASRIARSWNLMSDGRCLASLEDPESVLALPEGAL